MVIDPIFRAFARLAESAPRAALVVSRTRRADRGAVAALARGVAVLVEAFMAANALPEHRPIAFAAANGTGFLAGFLALRWLGRPALLLDSGTPEAERLRIARRLGAAAVLECPCAWPAGPEAFILRTVTPDLGEGFPEDSEAGRLPPAGSYPDLAVIKVTSGSTGAPRGIATPAEALIADDEQLGRSMGLTDDDAFVATVPMTHSYGLASLAMPALLRGQVLVLPEGDLPLEPLAAAEACGATIFPTVPAYLDALLRTSHPPAWPTTLRLALTAGAPLPRATAVRFRAAFGQPVHVFYGASESGGICFDREGGAGERGTVGTPIDGVSVQLLEPDENGAGVVAATSPAVAFGYLPEPDERLLGGAYRTSDLAAWKDGELALLGRVDDLVNIKGKKVNPREVERVLGELLGVSEVAVLGVPRAECGGEVLRAVIACRDGALSTDQVLAWCRPRLAAHKVPRSVVLVRDLPRTDRGKLDRAALLDLVRRVQPV
ncbi:MAG TPA: fatty acid--CoA ligase family protein [Thermoanaerobaculia bacterium]|jgi:long-chain acyl-CoA synthetase|nr:fatty acid--CoA ligase family protein [Thermoanaerobaculia bacterium]